MIYSRNLFKKAQTFKQLKKSGKLRETVSIDWFIQTSKPKIFVMILPLLKHKKCIFMKCINNK